MSTAQKRGFRLPWSSDRDATELDPSEDAQRLATFLEAAAGADPSPAKGVEEDEGPFHVSNSPDQAEEGAERRGPSAEDVKPVVEDAERQLEQNQGSEAVVVEGVIEGRASVPATEDTTGSAEGLDRNGPLAWPTTDRAEAPAHHADELRVPPTALPARGPRRENPLVAGLIRAMREAAESSRIEAISVLQAEAAAQIEAIKEGATTAAAALRKQADDDVAAIREWAKAEVARIRQESEQRVADRRESQTRDLEAHAAAVDRQIAAVGAAVTAYESETDRFFEELLAETDPARLATLAERAPEPPDLGALPGADASIAQFGSAAAPDAGPGNEPTGNDGADDATGAGEATGADDATGADNATGAGEATANDDGQPEALAPEAAAAAEAEAIEGLNIDPSGNASWPVAIDGGPADELPGEGSAETAGSSAERAVTELVVEGLTTVAGISAFKGALAQVPDVKAVSVSAGAPGTFVFSVSHGGTADLQSAIPQLQGFAAQVTADEGATLRVVAQEPGG